MAYRLQQNVYSMALISRIFFVFAQRHSLYINHSVKTNESSNTNAHWTCSDGFQPKTPNLKEHLESSGPSFDH
jgi:hypothetical protein